mgnify:CR=1 FL=1
MAVESAKLDASHGARGISARAEADDITGIVAKILDRGLAFAALCLVVAVFLVHAVVSYRSGLFTEFSLVEETAYTYTSARNYLQFGFLNSGLLQDFSTSPDPLDHPFLYNHMPPGPDIVMAVLLKLSSGDTAIARFILSLGALAGFFVYYRFCASLLERHGASFGALPILLLGVWPISQFMERPIYALFLLLAFLPFLVYERYLQSHRTGWLVATCAIIVLSSFYIEYSALSAVIACWILLGLAKLLPLRFRDMLLVVASFGFGIALHLLQNFLVLGPDVFYEELSIVLSNRITGTPSQEQMSAFYREIGVVHHGSHAVEWSSLRAQLLANVYVPGWLALVSSAITILALQLTGMSRQPAKTARNPAPDWKQTKTTGLLLARFAVWSFGTVLIPILLFPAFAQEVNLYGFRANLLFLGVTVTLVVSLAVREIAIAISLAIPDARIAAISGFYRRHLADWVSYSAAGQLVLTRCVLALALGFFLIHFAWVNAVALRDGTRQVISVATAAEPAWDNLERLREFQGLFMTNINVPLVGLLTGSPGYGVCGPRSIGPGGQIQRSECKVSFMRRWRYWSERRPAHFFYFSDPALFPGFADCLPANTFPGQARQQESCMSDLLDVLSSRYDLLFENKHVKVFDIGVPK